jgi:hypothetical protein
MSAETVQWYRSKIDWWLVPLLCLLPVGVVGGWVVAVLAGDPTGMLVGTAMLVLVAGIYFGLVLPIRYGLDDTTLTVRFGLCRQRISLADITEVHRTRNPLSSPALSLDRLHIQYGPGLFKSTMISPADRDSFLDELARKAGLTREGDRLVRT